MRQKTKPNYAFIDSQNLNLGIRDLDWKIDHQRFRVYLSDKYNVQKAYIFIGFLPENAQLYAALQEADFLKPYHRFMNNLRKKLEYAPKKKNPRKDKTLKGKSSIGDKTIVTNKRPRVKHKRKQV